MKITTGLFGAAFAALATQGATAQTVLNTSLPTTIVTTGDGVATTTTDANGTVTTVTGSGGGANRGGAVPTIGSWYQDSVGGGGSVGITRTYTNDGNGAAYLSTVDGNSKGDLRYNFPAPVALSSLTSLSYDFYRDASSTTPTPFAPTVRLDILKDGGFAGSLILEYKYQNQVDAPTGVWTSLSATLGSGIFWASNAALGPTFAAADGGQKTLAQWIADNNGSTLSVFGVSTGVGSGWSGGVFNGAVDHIAYGFAGGPAANFDFAVAGVPEPATWTLMIGGFAFVGAAARRRRAVAA